MEAPKDVLRKKKRKRRGRWGGKGGRVIASDSFSILHSNVNGYDSKHIMFNKIISDMNVDIVNLNEILLKGNQRLQIPGYSVSI